MTRGRHTQLPNPLPPLPDTPLAEHIERERRLANAPEIGPRAAEAARRLTACEKYRARCYRVDPVPGHPSQ